LDLLTFHWLGDVGVGGLLLGGGMSFLSAQFGLACDHVLNYEVILANASIVNANATSNTDLFFALKGGGNQFGKPTMALRSPFANNARYRDEIYP
jgi:FAD/FMN-containing dehydrogenase